MCVLGFIGVKQIIKTLNKNSKNAKSLVKNIINVLPKYINKENKLRKKYLNTKYETIFLNPYDLKDNLIFH